MRSPTDLDQIGNYSAEVLFVPGEAFNNGGKNFIWLEFFEIEGMVGLLGYYSKK